MSDETEVAVNMWKEVASDQKSKLENVPFTLYCYKGKKNNTKPPKFHDQDSGEFQRHAVSETTTADHVAQLPVGFIRLCSVQADLSKLPLQPLPKGNGVEGEFYRVKYSVVLLFNSAELKAHIRWEEVRYIRSKRGVVAKNLHRSRMVSNNGTQGLFPFMQKVGSLTFPIQNTSKCTFLRRQLSRHRDLFHISGLFLVCNLVGIECFPEDYYVVSSISY